MYTKETAYNGVEQDRLEMLNNGQRQLLKEV